MVQRRLQALSTSSPIARSHDLKLQCLEQQQSITNPSKSPKQSKTTSLTLPVQLAARPIYQTGRGDSVLPRSSAPPPGASGRGIRHDDLATPRQRRWNSLGLRNQRKAP